ncbi:MAG TPA: cation acetate symporter [Phycisphaerales bacterium]|nr:cation acetate symporter [Phycisphaerales bacterium]|tara:strand:- start:65 stop:2077 length:2013 start_codon:yes stop_codon:yes gene_type:complete
MTVQTWTYIFVGLSFGLYLFIAWISRVRDTKGFYVAGQGVPAIANGMATAADWMSAASFISMAGLISTMGYSGGVYLMGWTGGYVLLALLLAPYLRKFGHFTVPDFIGDRYNVAYQGDRNDLWSRVKANPARFVAVVCAIFVSFTYVVGQMKGVGVVFSRFLDVSLTTGVFIGMAIVFIYAVLGGMKGITWTQVAQYWVLITAFLVQTIAISMNLTGTPIPQIGLGSKVLESVDPMQPYLLQKLNQINQDFGFSNYTAAFMDGKWNKLNVFCVALALMCGTAGLPHVIIRFYTVKSVKDARWSGLWALLFISLLYLSAPALAGFARYYMLDSTAGLNGRTQETLPQWYHSWRKSGLVSWFDLNGDGKVQFTNNMTGAPVSIAADKQREGGPTQIQPNEIFKIDAIPMAQREVMLADTKTWLANHSHGSALKELITLGAKHHPDKDMIVLASPEMAGLANWIIAFMAAGGMAAALSTASGLLLVISSSIAHDLYYRVANPQASEASRLLVGRIVIGCAILVAGYFGIHPPGFVGEVVAFAFGLAAASFFPAIVLGIFSRRVGTIPAVTGMVVGLSFTMFYIMTQRADAILLNAEVAAAIFGPPDSAIRQPWFFGINAQGIGSVGMLLNLFVTLALTPMFPPPTKEVQDMVEGIREPEGESPAVVIEGAPGH